MRINRYVANATGMSRRDADTAISAGRVTVNGTLAHLGHNISTNDVVSVDGRIATPIFEHITILLNKPVGYVCSREGQGSKTIYELLPPDLHRLKSVGRLDKDSSGLLLLTSDGTLANELTHPKFQKVKVYEIRLNVALSSNDEKAIENGINIKNYTSSLQLTPLSKDRTEWQVTMKEGHNRQIRRTFSSINYTVKKLYRTRFGPYFISNIKAGEYRTDI